MVKNIDTINTILDKSKDVFYLRGYKDVTMTEIIEASGLDRQEFYIYFSSPEEIFIEMFNKNQKDIEDSINSLINLKKPAVEIIETFLEKQCFDLRDYKNLGCMAVYEFFFEHGEYCEENFLEIKYDKGVELLNQILIYGINTKEFKEIDSEKTSETIMLLLEGVRILKETTELTEETISNQIDYIKNIII